VYRYKKFGYPKSRGPVSTIKDPKFIGQVKRSIKKIKKYKKRFTAMKISKNLTVSMSLRSIQRCLHDNDSFIFKNIRRKIKLTDEQKSFRMYTIGGWIKENIDFKRVVYSDEARFSLDGPDNFMTWELENEETTILRPMRYNKGGSVMVFGAILFDGTFLIRKIDGNMTGEKYSKLLKDDIIPKVRAKYRNKFYFQQDNARAHTCKKVKKLLNKMKVQLLIWPSHSPDLNLIENVWHLLKGDVYDGQEFSNKQDLWIKIAKCVEEFGTKHVNVVKSMYDGVVDRYLKVYSNNGDLL